MYFSLLFLFFSLTSQQFVEILKVPAPLDADVHVAREFEMFLYSFYSYRFDYIVRKSTREIDLFVPQMLLNCVQKFSGLKEGRDTQPAEVIIGELKPVHRFSQYFNIVSVYKDVGVLALDTRTGALHLHIDGEGTSLFSGVVFGRSCYGAIYVTSDGTVVIPDLSNSTVIFVDRGATQPRAILEIPNVQLLSQHKGPSNDSFVVRFCLRM
jgi:hypothetical protein